MLRAYLNRKSVQGDKYLITGAAGFFGSHLVRNLTQRANIQVVGLDLRGTESVPLSLAHTPPLPLDKFTFFQADIRKRIEVEKVLKEFRPDHIVHLAAQSQVASAAKDGKATMETNVSGTKNLLDAIATQFSPSNFPGTVLASSERAYGIGDTIITENSPRRPEGPYATSKSMIINLAGEYARRYGMPLVTTCCVNIYGPGDLNWSRVIPYFFHQLFLDQPITIQRNVNNEGEISDIRREFLYIKATLSAYRLMIKNSKNPRFWGQHFNFGTGKPIKITDLAKMMMELARKKVEIKYTDRQISVESQNQRLSSKKARTLGWHGETTTLEQGLRTTYKWYAQLLRDHSDIV